MSADFPGIFSFREVLEVAEVVFFGLVDIGRYNNFKKEGERGWDTA